MAITHYVPAFTRNKIIDGFTFEETVCAKYVGWTAIAPAEEEPTCHECRVWLGLEPEPKEADTHGRTEDVVSGEGQEPSIPGDRDAGWGFGV